MPETAVIAPSTPIWTDLASSDIEASKAFYGKLFGWDADQVGGPEAGNYTMFTLRGKQVAGVGSMMEGQPPAWLTYICSANADETAARVRAAGGEVVMEPMDVMDSGRMCILRDPTGAHLGVWQAGAHKGAAIMREPGSFTWTELQTRDVTAAQHFYQQVFGWSAKKSPMGEGQPDYTEWQLDGTSVGGAMAMQSDMPAQVPPHWLAYFAVDNADRSAARVRELGGQVFVEPTDFPGGRFAVVADTHGAAFGILQSTN